MEYAKYLSIRYAITQIQGSTHLSITFNGLCAKITKMENGKILDIQFCSTTETDFIIRNLNIHEETFGIYPTDDNYDGYEIPKEWLGSIISLIYSCGMTTPIWLRFANTVKVIGTF